MRSAMLAAESWEDLKMSKELMEGIHAKNFVKPSRI